MLLNIVCVALSRSCNWECSSSCVSLCLSLSGLYPPSSNLSPSLWCGPPPQPALCLPPHLHLSVLLSNIPPLLTAEPYFLSSLCFSFLLWLPTCLTRCCFFLRPSTPLPVTQYFQFTLLLSNLPLHSSRAPLHYLPLSPFAFCPPFAVGLSEGWIQGSSFSLHSIAHTHIPHALTVKCVCGLCTLILTYGCFCAAPCFCISEPLCAFISVHLGLL